MNRLIETARGLTRLGLMMAATSALATLPAQAGKHHAAPVVGAVSPAYVMPAAPAYVVPAAPAYAFGRGRFGLHHRQPVVAVGTTAVTTGVTPVTTTTTASPPPFVGAVAPLYSYSLAPATAPMSVYTLTPAAPTAYQLNVSPVAASSAYQQAAVAPRSYLSQYDVPSYAAMSPQAAAAATPAGQRILQGLLQFARAHGSQIASALGPVLLQEANRLFTAEFGALPNSADFAILSQIVHYVLGLHTTPNPAPNPNPGLNLGNGQPIQVQNLTIQASSVTLSTPNVTVNQTPSNNPAPNPNPTGMTSAPNPNPNPGPGPDTVNPPPNTNPSDVSPPPTQ